MKTSKDILNEKKFKLVCEGDNIDREIKGVFCCDLLSIAMSKATADCAWVTVMANINTLAVATLVDVSCIVIAEGMAIDELTLGKAKEKGITIFSSDMSIYDSARYIDDCIRS